MSFGVLAPRVLSFFPKNKACGKKKMVDSVTPLRELTSEGTRAPREEEKNYQGGQCGMPKIMSFALSWHSKCLAAASMLARGTLHNSQFSY